MHKGPLILASSIVRQSSIYEPRQDYLEIARALRGDLYGYNPSKTARSRSLKLDLSEATTAYRKVKQHSVVISLSEKVAIPLALMLRVMGQDIPHILVAHKLTSGMKIPLLRMLNVNRAFSSIICVSKHQVEKTITFYGVHPDKIHFVYDKVDHHFFKPQDVPVGDYILAVGQEQRDYPTLLKAVACTGYKLIVVASSPWSTSEIDLSQIKANVEIKRHIPYSELRELYARARLVVVPLHSVDYAAGANGLLEAMAMAKPVIMSQTLGMSGYIEADETGLHVPPADVEAMQEAIGSLWENESLQKRLGENARYKVETEMNLDLYIAKLNDIVQKATT